MAIEFLKQSLKSVLSDSQKRVIKSKLDYILYQISRVVRRSKLLTTTYFYFRGTFYEEQRAILSGQITNYESRTARNDREPIYDLIRGTHRIEKGLSMQSRKDTFAKNYIEELVQLYISICDSRGEKVLSDNQFQWATDVLDQYFEVVEQTPVIERAYDQYENTRADIDFENSVRRPFQHKELTEPAVSLANLTQLAKRRHSTRWFKPRSVEHEKIDAALEVALEAPSACNRQPFEFRIFDDEEKIRELCKLPIGVSGYKENIPCLAILVGKHRAYFNERDKHLIYIDTSLAAMGFQYALETQGLSTCCINWPAIPSRERKLRNLLQLDDDEEAVMFMAIGYADPEGLVPYSEKRDSTEVRRFNALGNNIE